MVERDDWMTVDEFHEIGRHLDEVVQQIEGLPYPVARDLLYELLQAVDLLHRESLGRMVHLLRSDGQSPLLARLDEDPIVRTLLLLYDLTGSDPQDGPSSDPRTVPGSFIPLTNIGAAPRSVSHRPVFRDVVPLAELPAGTLLAVEVEGVWMLVANVDDEVYAVRNNCPGSLAPLNLGAFSPPVIICPWHNESFDVRTGQRLDGIPGPGLTVLPVSIQDGMVRLAVATTAGTVRR
jgi:nitrite reductase/ring-hydroxylating ferredoxin subunit